MSKDSRRQARERLKQERLRQQQRAKRLKTLGIIGAAVLAVVLIVGVGAAWMWYRDQSGPYDGPLAPQAVQADGSVVMAKEGVEAPVVEVYADFQCPACKQMEQVNSPTLKELAAKGEAIVHFRPVSIFAQQPAPISTNSLRAAGAARAAADYGKFAQYQELLFENQPPEGQEGFSPEDLKDWGKEAGITDPEFAKRVDAEAKAAKTYVGYYQGLIAQVQQEFSKEELQSMTRTQIVQWGEQNGHAYPVDKLEDSYVQGVLDATSAVQERYPEFQGTPSVFVNGKFLEQDATFTEDGLRSAVAEAGPGEVSTKPLDKGDAEPDPSASPSAAAAASPSTDPSATDGAAKP